MIVIEGPDGAGKSTLVSHLADKFGFSVGERGVANRDDLYKVTRQDTYRALSLAVQGLNPPCVWDRLFVSEFVYAGVVGRPCEFKPAEQGYIQSLMDVLGFPMIICLPPYDAVEHNVNSAHQMKGVRESLEEIYEHYEGGALPWPENRVWYDYTGSTPGFATLEEVESEVQGYLHDRKEREAWG